MTRMRSLLTAAVLATVAAPLSAQVRSALDKYPLPTTAKFKWNGVNSSMSSGCVDGTYNVGTVCVGPYSAMFNFNNQTPTGPAYDIFCVDFDHDAKTSGVQNVYLTNVSTGNLGYTRLGNTLGAQTKYMKAAWLANKFTAANHTDWRNIHGAIWNIMYGVPAADNGITNWINQANAAATAGYVGMDFGRWTVVTEQGSQGHGKTADSYNQEYLVRTVVPEPASLVLMGTGLLLTLFATGVLKRPTA